MGTRLKPETITPLPGTSIVGYTFQLRPGVFVRLFLPRDLTKHDVARLNRYMKTLVAPL